MQNLREQLTNMPHLTDIKQDAEKKVSNTPPEDPKSQKLYTFNLDFTDSSGKKWEGTFTHRIMTIKDHRVCGVMRAQLAGGLSYESLDPITKEINLILSTLEISLTQRPDWAKDIQDMDNLEVVQELYKKCEEHEQFFRTGSRGPEKS